MTDVWMLPWIKQLPEQVHHPDPLRFAIGTQTRDGAPGVWKVVEVTASKQYHADVSQSMCMYRLTDNTLVVCNNTRHLNNELKDGVVPPGMLYGIKIDLEKYIIDMMRDPTTTRPIVQKYIK
jgi:hypothetical protein